MAITILDAATAVASREGRPAPETGEDFARAGFDIIGGCERCGATLAAYNAHPSRSGYWRCTDCLGDSGFATVEEFEAEAQA